MNSFEGKNQNPIVKAEYNPNDVWDNWLIKHYGEQTPFDSEEEQERKSQLTGEALLQAQYDNATSNSEGDIIDPDGSHFGSFAAMDGKLQVEAPKTIHSPEEMEKWMDGSLRIRLDYSIQFQPDGPGTEGHMWQARLFDQIEGKEVPDSRILSNKLSFAIGAAMEHLPTNANEYVPLEQFLSDILDDARRFEMDIDNEEEQNKEISQKYPDYPQRDLMSEIMDKEESFSDIFMEGSMEDYVKKKIEELKFIDDKDKQMEEARKFRKTFSDLRSKIWELHRDINEKKFKFLEYKGEDIYGSDGDDETDGWMKPPDWKG